MKTFVLAALVAACPVAPAVAQSTGPRAEAIVGYDTIDADDDATRDGVLYGGQVGYDVGVGGVTLGVEGELTGASSNGAGFGVAPAIYTSRSEAGRDLYAGVRVGLPLSANALIYAKGGYTNARIRQELIPVGATTDAGTIRRTTDMSGFRVGAGIEHRVSGPVYLKGEYRYSHYGRERALDSDIARHQVLGGLGVRF